MGTGYKVAVASIVVLVLAVVSYYMFFAGPGDASSRAIDTSHLPAPTPPASAATPSQNDPSLTSAPGSVTPADASPGTVAHISDDEVQALLNSTAPAAATGSPGSTTPGSTSVAPRPTGSAPASGPALTLGSTDGSAPPIRPLIGTGTASSPTFTIPPATSSSRPATTLGSTNAPSLGEAGPSGSSKSYAVKQGDTLWVIAQKELGNGARWAVIARANPNVDPNNLRVGQKLIIPAASSSSASANSLPHSSSSSAANTAATTSGASGGGGKTIIVAEGDTLWSIAEAQLGDGAKWKLIFNANRGILSAPDDVQAGQKLVIPTR